MCAVDEKVNPAYARYQTTKNLTPAGSWFELSREQRVYTRIIKLHVTTDREFTF